MKKFLGYRCSLCEQEYSPEGLLYICPKDGGNLDIVLDSANLRGEHNPETVINTDENSLWRYLPLLPVRDPGFPNTPIHAAGWTPVYEPIGMGEKLGLRQLYVKDESRNPTASFKDRASAVVVARAREINADVIVTASTGNAGAALAGMAASVGQKAVIFAPRSAPPAKIAQLLVFGAQVLLVDGTYDDAFDLSIQAAQEFGWYCRNTGYNPFTAEGKKTAAYEIWEWGTSRDEQRSSFKKNLSVFVSVGDGNIISGIHKGFKDLWALGWLEDMPRIFGVQAEGSAAIANAFYANTEKITPVSANTLADSISVDFPRDGVRGSRAAAQTDGSYITVSDTDILKAIASLGKVGIFAEPAGAASYAGLVKALVESKIEYDDPVLVLNTGSGLKNITAALKATPEAPVIEPSLEAVKRMIK
ncbi:pyridoxal-phosphate dependent enzyme [Chloroflexota bacterium]